MKININQNVKVKNTKPTFEYIFNGEDIDVPDEHAEVILKNQDFYPVDDKDNPQNKDYINRLKKLKGIGNKTAKDLIKIYSTETELKEAIKKGEGLSCDDDVERLLKQEFGDD